MRLLFSHWLPLWNSVEDQTSKELKFLEEIIYPWLLSSSTKMLIWTLLLKLLMRRHLIIQLFVLVNILPNRKELKTKLKERKRDHLIKSIYKD